MIRNNSDRMRRRDEPGMHGTKRINNREKFFVMNFVVDFCRAKFAGMKGDRVEEVTSVWLKGNRGKGKVRSIGYKCRGKQRVKMAKKRSGGKRKFECLEGMFGGFVKAFERRLEVFVVNAWRGEASVE